jgi:hypothetical protein
MDLGQYWETIVAVGTPTIGIIIIGAVKYIKNKLAGSILNQGATSIKEELGEENYSLILTGIKTYGIKKAVDMLNDVIADLKDVKDIVPLIIAMSKTHLELGVYNELPAIKEIVEKTLDNVE